MESLVKFVCGGQAVESDKPVYLFKRVFSDGTGECFIRFFVVGGDEKRKIQVGIRTKNRRTYFYRRFVTIRDACTFAAKRVSAQTAIRLSALAFSEKAESDHYMKGIKVL